MSRAIDRDLIRSIFLHNSPLLDVRAPVEFSQGAFPCAVNQPLMDDQQRHDVGLRYKQQGQDAAIKLGHKLVSGELKEQRIAQWRAFAEQHPDGYLYCFRGGLRSRTVKQWLKESGIDLPLINGGYKAMRRVLIDELEHSIEQSGFIILGGRTGTGKTWLLKELSGAIDLEGLAHHRGSSFGRFPDGQPSQIAFENNLSIRLMQHRHKGFQNFWLEDEGRLIGSLCLPESLCNKMQQSPLVLLEEELQYRISITLKDYVIDLQAYYNDYYRQSENNQAFDLFATYLSESLARIKKRLGGERYQKINQQLQDALSEHKTCGDITGHRIWIESLLTMYYDPMYDYQLEKKQQQLIFSGSSHQIIANQNRLIDNNIS